jgi:fatty acid desaturase (delta-4 desaturase)
MLFLKELWMNCLVSPVVFVGVPTAWVFAMFALVQCMVKRKAVDTKAFKKLYNIVQIAVCSYMVSGLMPCLGFPNIFGINTEFDEQGEWFVFVHYLSKYLDWFDTLFIILGKKRSQLSFLHVYHHATIVPVWGLLLYSNVGSGAVRYGAWVNSLVHVIMYSHFLWTSFGLKNPLKKCVTLCQITQFWSCILHAILVLCYENTAVHNFAPLQVAYQTTMVYLFTQAMSWVPGCVPDLGDEKTEGEQAISWMDAFNSTKNMKDVKSIDINSKKRYVVIRDTAYDITNFNHPGGAHMIDLCVGRDATVMFESAHVRLEIATKSLAYLTPVSRESLEKEGYDFGPKETWPTPTKSELYETIRKRVAKEVIKPNMNGRAASRGVPWWHYMSVIVTWATTATWFVLYPGILSAMALGLALCWIGTGVQHTANHGGLHVNPKINYLLGLTDDIMTGGSSIVWRYHHQVSHHAYCGDMQKDMDAYSSYPILRLDPSQKWHPIHRFQAFYAPFAFGLLWFAEQNQDLECLLGRRAFDVNFKGTEPVEICLGIFLKLLHYAWVLVLPAYLHGIKFMLVPWVTLFGFGGCMLSLMFIVSHNTEYNTYHITDPNGVCPDHTGDWARQQIETSTSWGGRIGSFFSGGLNLQIEHHLFPCMAHHYYADAQVIIKEECKARGIRYCAYPTLIHNGIDFFKFLWKIGIDVPKDEAMKAEVYSAPYYNSAKDE